MRSPPKQKLLQFRIIGKARFAKITTSLRQPANNQDIVLTLARCKKLVANFCPGYASVMHPEHLTVGRGRPWPLGVSHLDGTLNFAVHTPRAHHVSLLLYDPQSEARLAEIHLHAPVHRTGTVWHVSVKGLPNYAFYSYHIEGVHDPSKGLFADGPELFDPFGRAISSHPTWGAEREPSSLRSIAVVDDPFDWQEVTRPALPLERLILYEMHVRGFTQDSSSGVKEPGTYLGVIEKIPYLKELGVNALELLPVAEFDECSYRLSAPVSGTQLCNYWGYVPLSYFSPMNRYAAKAGTAVPHGIEAIRQFKTMVRELHRAGIEVIVDVVYNHTGENAAFGPSLSYRGLDAPSFYLIDDKGHFRDYTGCGNTINTNHPLTIHLILESLRYWVNELQVDGFRFDLASIFTRGEDGEPLKVPPVLHLMSRDPVLSGVKLIAEAWDAVGLYQLGQFPRFGSVWSEWNGRFRDSVRVFIKGQDGLAGPFATALCGSSDLYKPHGRPTSSINFVTAHDGFTLRDLVSYNDKHNDDNGEENRDGTDKNDSWNCGEEGPAETEGVLVLRAQQMRNFHLALMISQGVPMLLMGDEYGHTKEGNNNSWCHDSRLNWFQWDTLAQSQEFYRFYRGLIHFRKNQPILHKNAFLDPHQIIWHGHAPRKPLWRHDSRFVAFTLRDSDSGGDLYIAFNADYREAVVTLPRRTDRQRWHRIVDTALPPPQDFCEEAQAPLVAQQKPYHMPPHSALLLKAFQRKS